MTFIKIVFFIADFKTGKEKNFLENFSIKGREKRKYRDTSLRNYNQTFF